MLNLGNAAVYLCSPYDTSVNPFKIFKQERNGSFLNLPANFCPSPTFFAAAAVSSDALPLIGSGHGPLTASGVSSSESGILSRYTSTVGEAYTSAERNWSVNTVGSEPP
jgi:hypothetical protein